MTVLKKLLHCPFCGGTDIKLRPSIDVPNEKIAACETCGARGPLPEVCGKDPADLWNGRIEFVAAGPRGIPDIETFNAGADAGIKMCRKIIPKILELQFQKMLGEEPGTKE